MHCARRLLYVTCAVGYDWRIKIRQSWKELERSVRSNCFLGEWFLFSLDSEVFQTIFAQSVQFFFLWLYKIKRGGIQFFSLRRKRNLVSFEAQAINFFWANANTRTWIYINFPGETHPFLGVCWSPFRGGGRGTWHIFILGVDDCEYLRYKKKKNT